MTVPQPAVVCVGNAIVDVLAPAAEDLIESLGLVKGTMRLVDPAEAETLYGRMGPATEASGGAAANTAAGLALLGVPTQFVGKVADDQLGKVFAHDIRAVGVGFDVAVAEQGSTGRCLVMITPDAQRTMSTSLGVAGELGPDDIDEELVSAARWTFLEAFLWESPTARAALDKAASVARTLSFSLSDPMLVGRHTLDLRRFCADHVDLLFGNEDEIKALAGDQEAESALTLVAGYCETVVMTRSEKGSLVAHDGAQLEAPAHPAEAVVDTTGAGDLFAAGFIAGLHRGLDMAGCAVLGAQSAAAVIAQVGARPSADQPPFTTSPR